MLKDIMIEGLAIATGGDPEACAEPMSGRVRLVEGLRAEGRFGALTIIVDEPVSFGGTNQAPNPAEAALAGLAASLMVTARCHAALLDITISDLSVDVSGSLDVRGFFGLQDIRPGFAEIRCILSLASDAPAGQLAQLEDRIARCCPVLDMVRMPTNVSLSLACAPSTNG